MLYLLGKKELKADMFLPAWVLGLGIFLLAAAIGCVVGTFVMQNLWFMIGTLLCAVLGTAAVMCWKNQKIRIIDDNTFEYTTFFGNKKTYYFSQIRNIRVNSDSLTMFVGEDKVHIETCAILSESLAEKINRALSNRTAWDHDEN